MPDIFIESDASSREVMQVLPDDDNIELRFTFEDQPDKLAFFLTPFDARRLVNSLNELLR